MHVSENETATPAGRLDTRPSVFATTHWSVVLSAGRGDAQAAVALEQLCRTYWPPLYTYVRRRGYAEADAKDLTQAFFAQLLARDWLGRADRQRGRFRSFLLTGISRFLANEWNRSRAQKRGGGHVVSLPLGVADECCGCEPANHFTPEQSFEWQWALTLLDRVMHRLCEDYAQQGKSELFGQLKPCLLGERTAQPYTTLAATLGMTEGSVKVAVHRLRRRYRQLLREEIAHTVAAPEEVEEEMRYLFTVLARR